MKVQRSLPHSLFLLWHPQPWRGRSNNMPLLCSLPQNRSGDAQALRTTAPLKRISQS
jgi:hypothetical protein